MPEQRTSHGGHKTPTEEAWRKGGEKTAQTHGKEFYEEIGREGGKAVSKDRQHMSEIGKKGGEHSHRGKS